MSRDALTSSEIRLLFMTAIEGLEQDVRIRPADSGDLSRMEAGEAEFHLAGLRRYFAQMSDEDRRLVALETLQLSVDGLLEALPTSGLIPIAHKAARDDDFDYGVLLDEVVRNACRRAGSDCAPTSD